MIQGKRAARALIGVVVALVVLACGLGGRTEEPTPEPTEELSPTREPVVEPLQGRIAFQSERGGNYDIYVMDVGDALQGADGSNLVRLTDHPAGDYAPAWSPDGKKIAFYSERDDNYEIYVIDVEDALQGTDGSNLVRLTDHPANDRWPAWSPDGKKIVFTSDREGNYEIYVMDVADVLQGTDGSAPVRLTNNPADDGDPAWSPDGTKIAFTSDRDGNYNYEIYVMSSDGGDPVRLTHESEFPPHEGARGPAWSPDGGQIAFASGRDGDDDIYVMNVEDALQSADGGDLVRLTDNPAFDEAPTWSPDGQKIAFQSYWGGNFEIYVMNTDGSGLVRLTNDPADDRVPAWAPQ